MHTMTLTVTGSEIVTLFTVKKIKSRRGQEVNGKGCVALAERLLQGLGGGQTEND